MVIRFARILLLTIAAALPIAASAETAIFYQPQQRDSKLAAEAWPSIFKKACSQGFDTLVIQWTRYGKYFSDKSTQNWLANRLKEAHAAKLKLVIGLAYDPDTFHRLKQPKVALENYLLKLSKKNHDLAKIWLKTLGSNAIHGWYLPIEIDDKQWRDRETRVVLKEYLDREAHKLQAILARPIHISTFFSGNMPPQSYAQMLAMFRANNGIKFWVQDGAGAGKLNSSERLVFLNAVSDCREPAAQGVIYELFRQTGRDEAFSATSLTHKKAHAIIRKRAPCNGDSVFFSLRYLPTLSKILPH